MIARRRFLLVFLKLGDLGGALAAFAVAWSSLHGPPPITELWSARISVGAVALGGLYLALWHLSFLAFGLYRSRRFAHRRDELIDLSLATTLAVCLLAALDFLSPIRWITPAFLVRFWLIAVALGVAGRTILRFGLYRIRLRGRNLRRMLVVGINDRTVEFARTIQSRPEMGYLIDGFVGPASTDPVDLPGPRIDPEKFPNYLREEVVDEVVLGLRLDSLYLGSKEVIERCEEQGIIVRALTSVFEIDPPARTESRAAPDLVTISHREPDALLLAAKRGIDVTLSAAALLILALPMLGIALLVRLSSSGPVFFSQERLGLNKRRFRMIKFRTMYEDAEARIKELEHLNEMDGPAFKIRNDPRITRVGALLRKTSLDELPQLINVLKGDMSLVGPRPLPNRDVAGFKEDWHRRRFSVRPGITCLWQISGRNSIAFDQWMRLDMKYIDEWSLSLDLKILLRTIPAVIRGQGAA